MKNLSLNLKRVIILLTPFSSFFVLIPAFLTEMFVHNDDILFILYLSYYVLLLVPYAVYLYFFIHHWRCPHCNKHLCNALAIFFGFFYLGFVPLLFMSPSECEHCGKKLDYNKSKPKKEKLPEWAQKFEKQEDDEENRYYKR